MIYNYPTQIHNIAELCDSHASIEYTLADKWCADTEWKAGILIGIKRFTGDFMFLIFDGQEKYVNIIRST